MEWALVTLYAAKVVLIVVERRLHRGMLGSRVRIVDHPYSLCASETTQAQPRASRIESEELTHSTWALLLRYLCQLYTKIKLEEIFIRYVFQLLTKHVASLFEREYPVVCHFLCGY